MMKFATSLHMSNDIYKAKADLCHRFADSQGDKRWFVFNQSYSLKDYIKSYTKSAGPFKIAKENQF